MNFSRFPRSTMFDFRREPPQTSNYPAPSPPNPPPTTDIGTSQAPPPGRPHANAISNPPKHLARPRTGSTNAGPPGQAKETGDGTPVNQDSITLGQLKAHTAGMKKEKTTLFDYRYDDTDTIMNELEEFYPYIEVPLLAESPERFKKCFPGEWTETSSLAQRQFIEVQLEHLESPTAETRRSAQQSLLYLLQGCFGETSGPETQLHWICTNARTLRSVDGVATLAVALKDAQRRYHLACEAAGEKPSHSGPSVAAPNDQYDERSEELMDVLAMLYFVVEVFRSDDTFGDELMAINPPLPVTLFQMVASMKDKLPKAFPVKKFLLLVWKVLLACLGGMKEVSLAKTLAREEAGLPMMDKDFTKSSPLDIASWRRDTSVKYPTFAPPPSISIPAVPNDKLAETPCPIPVRPNFHSTELPPASPHAPNSTSFGNYVGTPAPSPPPSPKPKKQQFQTDPSRPFVFPYSRIPGTGGPTSLVPFAISEADRLYHQHAYVPLSLYQLWQTREDCIKEERGLGRGGLIGFEPSQFDDDDEEEQSEWERVEWKYEMEEMECGEVGDKDGAKRAKQKKISARRLHRVDLLYKSTLSSMQSCIVVLLKLLLATVTSPTTGAPNSTYNGFMSPTAEHPPESVENQVPAAQSEPTPPTPSPIEIDITRHREITSKAVSAILILLLKWFKASHAIKGHYFAQLLFDSNCLLLVLKMFGLSDAVAVVRSKNECEDLNFFRYCHLNCSKTPPRPEDAMLRPPRPANKTTVEGEHETEVIFDYSWRNFFSTINFLKVLQKMTKHRTHRTFMMTQYKSSQILKRMLRVNQPMMQLQVLKLIKSQMPHCGRKWRQVVGNMKVITSIYLNCRPELRDEWLSGSDQELEPEDSHPQEMALRALVQFYNKRNYTSQLAPSHTESAHRRSNSISAVTSDDPASHRASIMAAEGDVFPPRRTDFRSYNPDGMIEFWLHEYEDVLSEVFGETLSLGSESEESDEYDHAVISPGDDAWKRLGEIMRGGRDEEEMSDSESVVSVGELGEDARMDGVMGGPDAKYGHQGENTWEHMSPKTMLLLPRSPAERRRSSSSGSLGSPLRPVIPQNLSDLTSDPFDEIEDEVDLRGPMPIEHGTADGWDRGGGAVDEVEYAFGE